MAQVRLAAAVAATTIAMSTLAVTGCSLRDIGSNIDSSGDAATAEIVASEHSDRYMNLFASAIDAIGWVVPLPFALQGQGPSDKVDARVSDVAVEATDKPQKYTL
jgi:hypothetical protein